MTGGLYGDGEGADDNKRMIAGIERLPAFLIMREPGGHGPQVDRYTDRHYTKDRPTQTATLEDLLWK